MEDKEPKFKFMECVVVTSGFFEGCKGIVKSYINGSYDVDLTCHGQGVFASFKEESLKSAKGCEE